MFHLFFVSLASNALKRFLAFNSLLVSSKLFVIKILNCSLGYVGIIIPVPSISEFNGSNFISGFERSKTAVNLLKVHWL